MPIDLIPGVTFFENWVNAPLGAGVPPGWTKLVGSNPTVASDPTSSSGKVLQIPSGLFGMTYNAAGSNHNHFEILMRVKQSLESQNTGPFSTFGGPGGRMSFTTRLIGVAADLTNRGATCICGVTCQACVPYPRGHPLHPSIQQASGHQNVQKVSTFGNNGSVDLPGGGSQDTNADTNVQSGQPVFLYTACGGGGFTRKCGTQNQYGEVTEWVFIRLRIGPEANRVRAVAWSVQDPEPDSWITDSFHINLHWPPSPSGGLGILQRDNTNRQGVTSVDSISFTLDPGQGQAPIPDPISSVCPLPDGRINVPYTFDLDIDNLVP